MPDPHKQTISATQAPALFNVSPYYTRWMLWQNFAKGMPLDSDEDVRMSWGKKLQPLVLEHAAAELRLEVRPNNEQYERRGRLGCSRDAIVICPDRGPGALETKCVFDYGVWMRDWAGGKSPPRHHEIQLQQQMLVADGEGSEPYRWGVLAAWVCGEVYYFERKPITDLWRKLESEAATFFDEVNAKREPDPFGAPVELPWLAELLPAIEGKVIDLSGEAGADKIVEKVQQYEHLKASSAAESKAADKIKAELLALAKDAEEVILPDGVRLRVSMREVAGHFRKPSTSKTLKVFVPKAADAIPPEELRYAG